MGLYGSPQLHPTVGTRPPDASADLRTCPECGTDRLADALFCANCGFRFGLAQPRSVPAAKKRPSTFRRGLTVFFAGLVVLLVVSPFYDGSKTAGATVLAAIAGLAFLAVIAGPVYYWLLPVVGRLLRRAEADDWVPHAPTGGGTAAMPHVVNHGPLSVQFQVTADDIIATSEIAWRNAYRWLLSAAIVIVALGGLIAFAQGDVLGAVLGLVPGVVLLGFLGSTRVRRGVLRILFGRRTQALIGDDDYILSVMPEGLRSQQGATTTFVGWADATTLAENADVLVILKGRSPRLFVPRRAFPDDVTLHAFRLAVATGIATAHRHSDVTL